MTQNILPKSTKMPGNKGKGFIDWSNTPLIEPEHPLSRPLGKAPGPILKKGEVPRKPTDEEISKAILSGAPSQPTNEQLFGGGVVTEEEANKLKKGWNNSINDWYTDAKKPVENQDLNKSWGCRGPIWKEELTEEEKRISAIPVNPSLLTDD